MADVTPAVGADAAKIARHYGWLLEYRQASWDERTGVGVGILVFAAPGASAPQRAVLDLAAQEFADTVFRGSHEVVR